MGGNSVELVVKKKFQPGEKEKIPQGLGTVGLCPLLLGPGENGSNLLLFFFCKAGDEKK